MTNLETVQQLYDAFSRRDGEAIRRIFHPQIEWIQNEGFPNGGRHVGTEAVLNDVFAKFRVDWERWQVVIHEYLDAGQSIVVLGEYRGTYKATGKSMVAAFAHVYDLHDGRIVRFRQYTDTAMLRAATAQ